MAVDDVDGKCGRCDKLFKTGEISINCELFCEKWFHIKCVNIMKNDYEKIESLGEHSKWFCNPCEQKVRQRNDGKEMCCDCFSYISVLTDAVKGISENQKEMSNNFKQIQSDHLEMKTTLLGKSHGNDNGHFVHDDLSGNVLRPSLNETEIRSNRDQKITVKKNENRKNYDLSVKQNTHINRTDNLHKRNADDVIGIGITGTPLGGNDQIDTPLGSNADDQDGGDDDVTQANSSMSGLNVEVKSGAGDIPSYANAVKSVKSSSNVSIESRPGEKDFVEVFRNRKVRPRDRNTKTNFKKSSLW